jgi:hypothetical protein
VKETVDKILELLPKIMTMDEAGPELFVKSKEGIVNSLDTFLG